MDDDRGELIDALVADHGQWLVGRCAKAAAGRTELDAGDLYQQTIIRLLGASVAVDPGNGGLRTFLSRCVEWATSDLSDQRVRQGGDDISPERYREVLDSSTADQDVGPEEPLDHGLVAGARLNPHETRAVLNDCGEPGVSAKEFAHMVARSHPAVRKDKERGIAKLRRWLGLDETETRVFMAVRRHGSVPAAATHLRLPMAEVRVHLASAQQKIDRKFSERRVVPDVH